MRVNLISNHHPRTGLAQDVNILRGILAALFEDSVSVRLVHYVQPHCDEADINIFIEVVNPSLLPYAAKNIWIPNHEWTYKTWVPYLHMMNEIWVKTTEAEEIFRKLTPTRVRYIGWTSLNKETPSKKNYFKAIVPLGKNIHREIQPLLHAYQQIRYTKPKVYSRLPVLNVVYNPKRFQSKTVSPRTLKLASNIMWKRGDISKNALTCALTGTVGDAASNDISSFLDFQDEIPTREAILKSPATTPIPASAGAIITLLFNLERVVDEDTLSPIMKYVERLDAEHQAVFCVSLARSKSKQKIAFTNKAFTTWARENNDIL
jgi:hypothetical protein